MKHLHNCDYRVDLPWVKLVWELYYSNAAPPAARSGNILFWWRDCLKSLNLFKGLAHCSFRDGKALLSWKDSCSSIPLQKTLPHLFSFAQNEVASVHTAISSTDLSQLFHLPLSDEALDELYELQTFLVV
jgi:hypothetical protein